MKKILLAITMLLYTSVMWGQSSTTGTSSYKLKITGNAGYSGSTCGDNITGGLQWIAAKLQNGSYVTVIQGSETYPNNGHGLKNQSFSNEYDFSKNNKVTEITYRTTHRNNGLFGCGDTDYATRSHLINVCDKVNYDFSGLNQPGNAEEMIFPIVQINTPTMENIYISSEEFLTISLTDNIDNQYYNWEYSIGGNANFVRFPSAFNNNPVLKIKGSDFLTDSDFGKTIFIRVNMGICSGSPRISDPVSFTYYKSSPHITSHTTAPTKCYDTTDGSLTLNFDRSLLEGETLEASLVNTTTGAAVSNENLTDALKSSASVTIENLSPGNYRLDLLGTYNSNATYTDGLQHTATFEITRPAQVNFSFVSKTNVFCHGGSDGIINITATGGQNSYKYAVTGDNGITIGWTPFDSGYNAAIKNLPAGTYRIEVQDTNDCPAKESGNIKVVTVQVTQPSAPIALSETDIKSPTGYGLSNGYISVRVTGGTPNDNGSYNFEWRKDSPAGALISANIITDAVNNPFTIKLDQVTAGKYYLTVKDKNYAGASSELGSCGILSQEYEVTQPDSLIATINIKEIISCHIDNDYDYKLDLDNNGVPDEAETGELTAVVTGGVGSYNYQWQILTDGSFEDIPGATSSVLAKLQEGTYKVLVKDVNDNKADDQKIFNYPEILKISLSANTILCNDRQEGVVSVTATGGTAPYTYIWNTSDTTPSVTGLGAGNYFVVVQDANGCMVSGSVRIEQPGALEIEDILVQDPVCNGASNGEIQIKASGGKTPYSITWSNGQTGEHLSGLKAGNYTVTFTDANGCSMTKSYNLTDPEALMIDLGKDITLCQGDSMVYNIDINDPGATYQWIDQEGNLIGTAPVISLSVAGTYTAIAVDSKGCTATDQVVIKNSMEVLSPEFMITTHAYIDYTVQLVNTSPIEPEKVEWILPESDDIQVIYQSDEYMELKFLKTGSYSIGLKGIQGECEKTFYKDILVEENTTGAEEQPKTASNVKEFTIVPNPNDGNYKVMVKLYESAPVKLRIISMRGYEPYKATTRTKAVEFEVPFQQTLSPGVYLIILETGSEVQVKRMLVSSM